VDRVQGNRGDETIITWDDLKLIISSGLREALDLLEAE
jgi:hypothetical protein